MCGLDKVLKNKLQFPKTGETTVDIEKQIEEIINLLFYSYKANSR